MVEQHIWNEARFHAKYLVENRGFHDACSYVIAEMDFGLKDRQDFWLRVWKELKAYKPAGDRHG